MDTLCSVGIILVSVILGTTADTDYGDVQRRLDGLKHVERARLHRRDVPVADELNTAITRLIKREAIKHNNFKHLKNIHLALVRRKRGWIRDDLANRATEFPTSTTSTPQTPPPSRPQDTSVSAVTNTTTPASTTSPASTTVATSSITYSVNTTDSSFTTMSTTESSSTNMLPYLLNHVVAIVIVLIFL